MFRHRAADAKGFTLIEVLVVVAIIGILTAILVANYNEARKNSRDKVRKSDLKSLQLAIELYKAQHGRYPVAGCGAVFPQWAGSESDYNGSPAVTTCVGEYIVGLAPSFIPTLPVEMGPTKNRKGYAYTTDLSGSSYKVIAHHSVEAQLVSGYSDEFARYPNSGCLSPYPATELDVYSVYSAGAECW